MKKRQRKKNAKKLLKEVRKIFEDRLRPFVGQPLSAEFFRILYAPLDKIELQLSALENRIRKGG